MINIKTEINLDSIKKIFGNKPNAIKFLTLYDYEEKDLMKKKADELYQIIINKWDYKDAKEKIRKIFKETEKFKNGEKAQEALKILLKEWTNLKLGSIEWPFSQSGFDDFVQRINTQTLKNRCEKDNEVQDAALRYRRIKEINTIRNDFLETLIVENNLNIIPTLSHRRGLDFFINGISYDQKVARSPTEQFKKKHPDNWQKKALQNPQEVAKYLYKYQDEGRFGATPRLFIVYLEQNVSPSKIKNIITNTNFKKPYEITFSFKHKNEGIKTYDTQAFVIFIHSS